MINLSQLFSNFDLDYCRTWVGLESHNLHRLRPIAWGWNSYCFSLSVFDVSNPLHSHHSLTNIKRYVSLNSPYKYSLFSFSWKELQKGTMSNTTKSSHSLSSGTNYLSRGNRCYIKTGEESSTQNCMLMRQNVNNGASMNPLICSKLTAILISCVKTNLA